MLKTSDFLACFIMELSSSKISAKLEILGKGCTYLQQRIESEWIQINDSIHETNEEKSTTT